MKTYTYLILLIALTLNVSSCKKDFLEAKPNKILVVPKSLDDFQALLDNKNVMNNAVSLQLLASDDFYTGPAGQLEMEEYERKAYTWDKSFILPTSNDWSSCYSAIFYANIILDGLAKIEQSQLNQTRYNNIKGSALFFRAFAVYNLAQVFASAYQETQAGSLPGIPIPISSDVNQRPPRNTVQATYQQILKDVTEAETLLNAKTDYVTRPSKGAAWALQARIYQTMGNYTKALQYCNMALSLNSKLINFNDLDKTADHPFPRPVPNNNLEVIFYAEIIYSNILYSTAYVVQSDLYEKYDEEDLRRSIFFTDPELGAVNFKGTYTGRYNFFGGLATNEMYLIKAECLARDHKIEEAMDQLNVLLISRWENNKFEKLTASTTKDALQQVLQERRKELISRGLRWTDLRRLNQDPELAVTLKRILNGNSTELLPGDLRYTFPIPQDEILYNNLLQNPR